MNNLPFSAEFAHVFLTPALGPRADTRSEASLHTRPVLQSPDCIFKACALLPDS